MEKNTVFSNERVVSLGAWKHSGKVALDTRLKMDGLTLLGLLDDKCVPTCFFDPQYRGILDKQKFGNEGKKRGKRRCDLSQMSESVIMQFMAEIDRVLIPSGHLFLWVDKFELINNVSRFSEGTSLTVVDMITWNKGRIGMGYRSRRTSEYLVVLQKSPRRAKGVWTSHNIPDVWTEKVKTDGHTHSKPIGLQAELIKATTNVGDVVLDPAAGSFSVMGSARVTGRHFVGGDING